VALPKVTAQDLAGSSPEFLGELGPKTEKECLEVDGLRLCAYCGIEKEIKFPD
jgi:hypothetical protein